MMAHGAKISNFRGPYSMASDGQQRFINSFWHIQSVRMMIRESVSFGAEQSQDLVQILVF